MDEEQALTDDPGRNPGGRTQPLEVGLQRHEAELLAQLSTARAQNTSGALLPGLDQPCRQLPERTGLARTPWRARLVTNWQVMPSYNEALSRLFAPDGPLFEKIDTVALLYQLDSFYVEIYYRKYRCHVLGLRCFTAMEKLDPYLDQVPVDNLVNI